MRQDFSREDLPDIQHMVDGMSVYHPNFDDALLDNFVHNFYGFGNFHGKHWFIGMEEGGGKSFQEISQRLLTWSTRGKRELEDVAEFHRWIGITELFSDDPKIQPTWGRLIRLLHISKYKHTPVEEIKEYQRDHLGRLDGDTCLLELFPLPSPSTREWLYSQHSRLPYLIDRNSYRQAVAEFRIEYLQQRIREYQPKYVIFYGTSYRRYWEKIIGQEFITADNGLQHAIIGSTRFFMVKHPAWRKSTDKYFDWIGRTILKMVP